MWKIERGKWSNKRSSIDFHIVFRIEISTRNGLFAFVGDWELQVLHGPCNDWTLWQIYVDYWPKWFRKIELDGCHFLRVGILADFESLWRHVHAYWKNVHTTYITYTLCTFCTSCDFFPILYIKYPFQSSRWTRCKSSRFARLSANSWCPCWRASCQHCLCYGHYADWRRKWWNGRISFH